ncbi:MAG TPA: UDP-2,3-diacylglucosamine diphosphatase [Chitinophagales bacterium]|nr:UDP-2,3-diacylglucosamine diphosphatase [Chitinophagales bacterium]
MERTKIYFASDFHLGIPNHSVSLEREKKIVRWLDSIKHDAKQIFLLGDTFDFWFEYDHVVPRGYVRLLGKLAELRDSGIDIQAFTGNHDLWMFGYFEEELNIPVHHHPIFIESHGKKFYIGHGDGVGPGDRGFKLMKSVFTNRFAQFLYSLLHPYLAFKLARYFSHNSRMLNEEETFLGEEKEWQIIYAKEMLQKEHIDYFLFGHRHIVLELKLSDNSTFINLGDWVRHYSFAEFDGQTCKIKYFEV